LNNNEKELLYRSSFSTKYLYTIKKGSIPQNMEEIVLKKIFLLLVTLVFCMNFIFPIFTLAKSSTNTSVKEKMNDYLKEKVHYYDDNSLVIITSKKEEVIFTDVIEDKKELELFTETLEEETKKKYTDKLQDILDNTEATTKEELINELNEMEESIEEENKKVLEENEKELIHTYEIETKKNIVFYSVKYNTVKSNFFYFPHHTYFAYDSKTGELLSPDTYEGLEAFKTFKKQHPAPEKKGMNGWSQLLIIALIGLTISLPLLFAKHKSH
jgi:hypothetical protein